MIIDASDLILGRVASYVAKKALMGEKIDIVNCEKAIMTGNKDQILAKYKQKRERGPPLNKPIQPRMPDRFVRRAIRGMLPYKRERGKKAFKSIMCYIGVPSELKDQKAETIKEANVSKVPNLKYLRVEDICKFMGAKITETQSVSGMPKIRR